MEEREKQNRLGTVSKKEVNNLRELNQEYRR